jgi:uncharacterized protein (TIGR03435 family)
MRQLAIFAVAALVAAAPGRAQERPTAPAFEAASIKPNNSGDTARAFRIEPGGNLRAINVTVRHLMWNAYGVQDFQIIGGPSWAGTDRYDIVARTAGSPQPEELRPMLRALLAERFKLKVQQTTRELPIYVLVMARADAKPGPKLRAAEGPCATGGGSGCGAFVGAGTLRSRGLTMARLAGELTGHVSRPVRDQTGLAGAFDLELDWAPDFQADGASLFTALQEQLGLKLESRVGPVDIVVIESVERPIDN